MSKRKNKVHLTFPGMNAFDVTGSMTLVEFENTKILLEAGLYQSNNPHEDFKINSRKLPFKAPEINYIIIGHNHADHSLLIPRLFAMGCRAQIIAPSGTKELYRIMALDSAFIISKDAEFLSRKFDKNYKPYYTEEDVLKSLEYYTEMPLNKKINMGDFQFRLLPSQHIINSAQIELWIDNVKIGYTSDIGSSIPKLYTNKFTPIKNANILIGECTYARERRDVTIKDRNKDLEKIKSVITSVCCDNGGRVLIPVFSLDRAQNMLSFIYNLFADDASFNIPVLIDSPLTIKMFDYIGTQLSGEEKAFYDKVVSWENVVRIETYEESKMWRDMHRPCVILSASGMLQAGRSRQWASALLPDRHSHIIFCGYSGEGSLGWQIKNISNKSILIDGKRVKTNCGVTDLKSFSGHMSRGDLMKYYSNVNCEKIYLVHGNMQDKIEFAKELQEKCSLNNKTTKVISVNKDTEIFL